MIWKGTYSPEWQPHFAILPTSVESGTKVVWLQRYWRRYVKGSRCQLKSDDYQVGHWETRSTYPQGDDT